MYEKYVKRIADIIFSFLVLVLLMPIWLVVASIIVLNSPGNPIFMQERVGLGGKTFTLYKFRTMISDAFKYGKGFYFDGEDDWRITPVGKVLRKLSLDEIPQLFNVLKGDMSIIGPRPMLPYQHDYLSEEQRQRFAVRPGITGLAQVSGRNNLPWSQRIELDIEYVNDLSFCMDISIAVTTITACFEKRDISYDISRDEIEDFMSKEVSGNEHNGKESSS